MPETKSRILVVDDDVDILQLIQDLLSLEGYEINLVTNGKAALEKFSDSKPDLILLDLVLPDIDGYTICRRIRLTSQIPIIMVTAKGNEKEKIEGFQAGADDYITKPFSSKELLARVTAVLRRSRLPEKKPVQNELKNKYYCNRDLKIDFERNIVLLKEKIIDLTITEYKLLVFLAQNSGRIISPQEILTKVWGEEYNNEFHLLQVNIARLRQKLNEDFREPLYVETKTGQGYLFTESD
jgi:DNA-binding response OmpR family regulator